MRYFLVIAFVLISSISLAQDNTSQLNWLTNVEQAEAISQQENKPILIYFTGSDWCSPCVALKKDFFETQEFAERAKNMVLVKIDYPRRMDIITPEQRVYNKTIISKYNTGKSFPNLVMINSKGAQLGNISGYSSYNTYQDTSHHFNFVDEYLAKNN